MDTNDSLSVIIQNNIKPIIILVVVVTILAVFMIISIAKLIINVVSQYKDIHLGPIKLSSKKIKEVGNEFGDTVIQCDKKQVPIKFFITILDAILSSQLTYIIKNCVDTASKIEKYVEDFENFALEKINNFIISIKQDYHQRVIELIKKFPHDENDTFWMRNTPEFSFLNNVLASFETRFVNTCKNIMRKSDFINFKLENLNAKEYLDELKDCVFKCIDPAKVYETRFNVNEFNNAFSAVNDKFNHEMGLLLLDISTAKTEMVDKREMILKDIDDITTSAVTTIIDTLLSKVFESDRTIDYYRQDN